MKTILAAGLSLLLLGAPASAQDEDAAAAAASPETMLGMMKTEMTRDPRGDFARMMIHHHQSAIDMVDVLLQQKDVDPEIRNMAEKMKKDQTSEISQLKSWLDSHQR
jgi:uncharacterized protein (DUF305 family)